MIWTILKGAHLESNDTQNSPAERALFFAVLTLVVGLALVGTVSQTAGGVVTLGSWLYFVYALHRYGRSGGPTRPARKREALAPTDVAPRDVAPRDVAPKDVAPQDLDR